MLRACIGTDIYTYEYTLIRVHVYSDISRQGFKQQKIQYFGQLIGGEDICHYIFED